MDKIVEEVIKRSSEKIQFENGSPFTKEGFDSLKIEISSYVNDIIYESFKIAKRNKSDLISKSHIESASFNLIRKRSHDKRQLLSSIGGFLFGFAVSKAFEMLADSEKFNSLNTLLLLGCGIVGAFLLGVTLFSKSE